jgi:S1-C subfamily serine protease
MENTNIPIWVFPRADDLSLAEIEALGLNTYTGAYVVTVTKGGPADQAGSRRDQPRPASKQ